MKKLLVLIVAVAILGLVACSTHIHQVGAGAQGSDVVTARQWYALFGLIPINEVDSHAMAGGATDYTIKTEQSLIDGVITYFTSIVTVSCQTVTVTK